jgi:hypothetical protein
LDNCDLAGIIEPDLELARFQIGATEDLQRPFDELRSRLEVSGKKYLVRKFVVFQYGETLNPANTAHRGVIRRLESLGFPVVCGDSLPFDNSQKNKGPSKVLQRSFKGAQDKDKDKDKKRKRSGSESVKMPEGIDPQHWSDWIVARKGKAVTRSVLSLMQREAAAANLTLAEAIKVSAEKGWVGFQAEWWANAKAGRGADPITPQPELKRPSPVRRQGVVS